MTGFTLASSPLWKRLLHLRQYSALHQSLTFVLGTPNRVTSTLWSWRMRQWALWRVLLITMLASLPRTVGCLRQRMVTTIIA